MAEKISVKANIRKILLQRLAQRRIHINKIIIFGSYAKRRQREESDIDLIIVSRDFRDKDIFERASLTTGIGRELVRRTGKPFDIMFYSDREWEEGNSIIITAARQEGEVVYSG
jgi:predicted nucleotidyltransferase